MKNYTYAEADLNIIKKCIDQAEKLAYHINNNIGSISIYKTAYYVSSSTGDDNNDGLTPATPWKTIEKVNSHTYNFGDGVFLKRGDSFRIKDPLVAVSGVSYSAYGDGDKPKLICSIDASDSDSWVKTDAPDIYKYTKQIGGFDYNIGNIIFDDGCAWGIHVSKMSDGTRLDNGTVYNGIEEYTTPYGEFSGYKDLKGNLEFYHNFENGADELYLYSAYGHPAEVFSSIELADNGHGIVLRANPTIDKDCDGKVTGHGHDILIDNIEVFGSGAHGVSGGWIKNVTVQYCSFNWIGGSVQGVPPFFGREHVVRYGNAVESVRDCENYTIHHNFASQVYDCTWTSQSRIGVTMKNLHIHHNVTEFANTGSEVWIGDGGNLINMKIHDNYDLFIGYGWSHQRPIIKRTRNKREGYIGCGGFFYGQYNTGMNCENCDVCNNAYIFCGSSSHSVGAITSDKYNFHNNTYIMEQGKRFATAGRFIGDYNEETIKKAVDAGGEIGTKFYYTKPNILGDMYKQYQIKYGKEYKNGKEKYT